MKAIDLHNGIRRAIQGLQNPIITCQRLRRIPITQRHASLPYRTQKSAFSSSTARCAAELQPPNNNPVSSSSEDAYLPGSGLGLEMGDGSSRELPPDFKAAPAIPDLEDDSRSNKVTSNPGGEDADAALLKRVRVVPASPSYFTSRPHLTDHYLEMSALLRRYQLLPTTSTGQLTKITWKSLNEYRMYVGEEAVQAGMYKQLLKICVRLSQINPHLMPEEVRAALQRFIKTEVVKSKVTKGNTIDSAGRAYGLGRRKAATARAWIVKGEGEIMVNGKTLSQYFSRMHQRESAIYALKVTERVGQYNVFAIAEGGGNTGQAEALTLAVANALLVYEPSLKNRLRAAGCITRDRRRVERKKPGHLKARKKPAWVKR